LRRTDLGTVLPGVAVRFTDLQPRPPNPAREPEVLN